MARALILRTAGTNCERETAHAFRRAGAVADIVHIDRFFIRICRHTAVFQKGRDAATAARADQFQADPAENAVFFEQRDHIGDGSQCNQVAKGFQVRFRLLTVLPETGVPEMLSQTDQQAEGDPHTGQMRILGGAIGAAGIDDCQR